MDHIVQWAWDRFGARYSWVICAVSFVTPFPIYLLMSCAIVAFEKGHQYLAAAMATAVMMLILACSLVLPGCGAWRLVERWAADEAADPAMVLEATYRWSRGAVVRGLAVVTVCGALLAAAVGVIAGAAESRLIQYAVLGGAVGAGSHLIGLHSVPEGPMRPVRAAVAGDSGIGDSLPRSRPTFAAWSKLTVVATAFAFSMAGAMVAAEFDRSAQSPLLWVVIGLALTSVFAVPITIISVFGPSLQPIEELSEGTKRVVAGDYTHRLPVVQDDDLGVLTASFNRMQAGLAERQRLQAAFGNYVDPILAARLLEQGDDVFRGERREVTVMFVDVRDFTPFAEANTAELTVARLNELFEIVVPTVVNAGGHVNKFLGDGALAVFGAPNDLENHADAALRSAVTIDRRVAEKFGGEMRIGVGINTGVVIAGTIGAAGHLEFTLIGDTTNIAARVEQLTKTTGDVVLLTEQSVRALAVRPAGLIDRGPHSLKGKSAQFRLFGVSSTHA